MTTHVESEANDMHIISGGPQKYIVPKNCHPHSQQLNAFPIFPVRLNIGFRLQACPERRCIPLLGHTQSLHPSSWGALCARVALLPLLGRVQEGTQGLPGTRWAVLGLHDHRQALGGMQP
jgi:hypothetical protein